MSRKTDLAVRNLELKCRRSGKRIFSAAALAVALGICTLAAVGIQKYGTAAMKDGVSDKGNGLRAVFAMFTGGAERGSKKIDESVLAVMSQVDTPVGEEKVDSPFSDACLPVNSTLNSGFGYRHDPFENEATVFHRGVDVNASDGTEVKSVLAGKVVEVGYNDIGGNFIRIDHSNGFITYYGHLQQSLVKEGETVERAQIIALSGHTGNVTGAHLHFQIEYGERFVDPEVYFKFNEE